MHAFPVSATCPLDTRLRASGSGRAARGLPPPGDVILAAARLRPRKSSDSGSGNARPELLATPTRGSGLVTEALLSKHAASAEGPT